MGLSLISEPRSELWKFGRHERAERRRPLKLDFALLGDAGGSRFETLRLQGAGAGYQVTAGKLLCLTQISFHATLNTASFVFGYSDQDVGLNSALDGANAVDADRQQSGVSPLVITGAYVHYMLDVYYEVPAGKFPRVWCAAAQGSFYGSLLGHEV